MLVPCFSLSYRDGVRHAHVEIWKMNIYGYLSRLFAAFSKEREKLSSACLLFLLFGLTVSVGLLSQKRSGKIEMLIAKVRVEMCPLSALLSVCTRAAEGRWRTEQNGAEFYGERHPIKSGASFFARRVYLGEVSRRRGPWVPLEGFWGVLSSAFTSKEVP